jgi:hypothetical protein
MARGLWYSRNPCLSPYARHAEEDDMKILACMPIALAVTLMIQGLRPAPDVRNVSDPDHPGKWTLTSDFRPWAQSLSATAAQTSAISARMAALAEVIHAAPVLNAVW